MIRRLLTTGIFLTGIQLFVCQSTTQNNNKNITEVKTTENDWDLEVFDHQFDYFLKSIARPKSFYTESDLKFKNTRLVNEWNSLFYSGKHRDIIESQIDYHPNEQYGIDFEYKLYQVFVFVHWKYGLQLQGLQNYDRILP